MNFFSKLFGTDKQLFACPRCLGKGHVDQNDLKRLKRELEWGTGACAYCNGTGKVDADVIKNVPADFAYLTTSIVKEERDRIIVGNPDALMRAAEQKARFDAYADEVCYLHFDMGLTAAQVCGFFLINEPDKSDDYKQELFAYIEKIIEIKGEEYRRDGNHS